MHSGDWDRQSVETPCVRGWAVGRDATSQIVCTMFGPTGPIAFVHSCAFNWQSEETPLVRCWQSAETPPSGCCRQVWPRKTLGIEAVLRSIETVGRNVFGLHGPVGRVRAPRKMQIRKDKPVYKN